MSTVFARTNNTEVSVVCITIQEHNDCMDYIESVLKANSYDVAAINNDLSETVLITFMSHGREDLNIHVERDLLTGAFIYGLVVIECHYWTRLDISLEALLIELKHRYT